MYCTEELDRRSLALARQVGEKRCGTVCAIWGLYWHAPSTIRQSVHLSMPYVKRGTRQTPSRPHPLRRGLSAHLLREDRCGQPKAVAQLLSTIGISLSPKRAEPHLSK